jgi:site-specific DNA-cytosine methylase
VNLELFSCSGGMAEGFRRAGIRFDFVFDKDPDACASYAQNLGHAPIQMDVHDLLAMVRGGWSPGPINLLVADPPCTPWSRAGKRQGLADERDMLRETAELIALLKPREYLIGNVPGLLDASSWGVVQDVIGGLARQGYCVDDYACLDAADFGVPQHRVRPFWFGHRGGPCISWPVRTHCSPTEAAQTPFPGFEPLKPWVTCRQALSPLAPADLGRPVRLRWTDADRRNGSRMSGHVTVGGDDVSPTITREGNDAAIDSRLVGRWKHGGHLPSRVDEPALTVTAAGQSSASAVLLLDAKHPISSPDEPSKTVCAKDRGGAQGGRAMEWPWDIPSTTICTNERQPPPGRRRGESQRGHPNAIVLSERAAKILQGFPESWVFVGMTKRSRWSQIGMAMPPPLAEAVARAIVSARVASAQHISTLLA